MVSADDPRLDDYRDLRDPERRRRHEAAAGTFVAEGLTVVERVCASGLRVRSVLVLAGKEDRVRSALPPGVALLVASRDLLGEVAGFDVHRGVLACAERPPARSLAEVAGPARTLAVLEGLNDHENLGAIVRSARALGVDGLVLDPTCADPWYRRTVRVSMGEVCFLPMARTASWPADLATLRDLGFVVIALTPDRAAPALGELARPPRVALLLGAEGPGLSAPARAAADVEARIPIRADVDSLNVGHAAAIAFAALGGATSS